jgi:O-antigen/teichoic acid export membrane protein
MLSVATGMIFALLVTRNTSPPEFGVWGNVFDLVAYFAILAGAIPFWITRFVARGKEGAIKTGFAVNLIMAAVSVALYTLLIPLFTSILNIGSSYLTVYFIASMYIAELYLTNVLEAVLRAKRPQAVGYGLLIEEICKVLLTYVLIVMFPQQPLIGAIMGLITGFLLQIIYYSSLVWQDFNQKIQWNYIREWLKGSIANVYYLVGNQIAAFILILLFTYGGPEIGQNTRSYYGAAATIANVVGYSFFLSFALYPKMLAEKSTQDVTISMKMVLMFAFPMAAGVLAIPDSFLTILGESYRQAAPILTLLAVDALTATMSQFYIFVLFGVEKLDEQSKVPLKQLVRSHIFKVFTLPYIHSIITLPTVYYVLLNFAPSQSVQVAIYVTVINMAARFAMFLILLAIVRKAVLVAVPWRSIGKYVLASAAMAILLYVLPHPTRIITTLGMAVAGGIIYFVLLGIMDKEARELLNAILQEIRGKLSAII